MQPTLAIGWAGVNDGSRPIDAWHADCSANARTPDNMTVRGASDARDVATTPDHSPQRPEDGGCRRLASGDQIGTRCRRKGPSGGVCDPARDIGPAKNAR